MTASIGYTETTIKPATADVNETVRANRTIAIAAATYFVLRDILSRAVGINRKTIAASAIHSPTHSYDASGHASVQHENYLDVCRLMEK